MGYKQQTSEDTQMTDLYKVYNNGECLIKYATMEEVNALLDAMDDCTSAKIVYQCTQGEFDRAI